MKNNKLIDAIGLIKDDFIQEAHSKTSRSFSVPWSLIGKFAAAAACLLLIVNIFPWNNYSSASSAKEDSYYSESSQYAANGYYADAGSAYVSEYYDEEGIQNEKPANLRDELKTNQKLILTAKLTMDTLEMSPVVEQLLANVNKYGGYVQSSTASGRSYEATIRVPADKYQDFIAEIKGSGTVKYYTEDVQDVTDQYTDIQSRLNSLRAQEAKVLEFYEKCETIEDLMAVEERLSEIQYEIEYLETQIKNYDLKIAYSTLYITINETSVITTERPGFFARIGSALKNGFFSFIYGVEDFLVDLSYNIFSILFFVAIIALIYYLYRKIRNRKNKKVN